MLKTIALIALGLALAHLAHALEKPGLVQSVTVGELMTPGPLGDQALGNPNAPLIVVEYSSMTCPHCAEFHLNTFPEVKRRYVDAGRMRFVFREFPLDLLAVAAAVLARCSGSGNYFRMIDMLFTRQNEWMVMAPLPPLFAIASQAGFTKPSFDECLANKQIIAGVEDSRARRVALQCECHPDFLRQWHARPRRRGPGRNRQNNAAAAGGEPMSCANPSAVS